MLSIWLQEIGKMWGLTQRIKYFNYTPIVSLLLATSLWDACLVVAIIGETNLHGESWNGAKNAAMIATPKKTQTAPKAFKDEINIWCMIATSQAQVALRALKYWELIPDCYNDTQMKHNWKCSSPSHSDILENEKADKLAREGAGQGLKVSATL